jgi:putative transposase
MAIKDELLDQLLEGYQKPEDLLGEDGIFQELKKALVEKALGAELTHDLGYEKGEKPGRKASNTRNGHGKKKVKGDHCTKARRVVVPSSRLDLLSSAWSEASFSGR